MHKNYKEAVSHKSSDFLSNRVAKEWLRWGGLTPFFPSVWYGGASAPVCMQVSTRRSVFIGLAVGGVARASW